MRRFTPLVCAALFLFQAAAKLRADGNCPWYNIVASRYYNYPREMARINGFWQGYYGSLQSYYGNLSNLDWASYYKNYGTPIGYVPGSCGGPGHVQMAPIFASPTAVQWGVPGSVIEPPTAAPPGPCVVPPSAPEFYPQ